MKSEMIWTHCAMYVYLAKSIMKEDLIHYQIIAFWAHIWRSLDMLSTMLLVLPYEP